MIAVIDAGAGNTGSMLNALRFLGANAVLASRPAALARADKVVFPGVGNFGSAMQRLRESGLADGILQGIEDGKPLFGVCIGMQALFDASAESPDEKGLGVFEGTVERFACAKKVPQIGWNKLEKPKGKLLEGVPAGSYVYYVNSYCVKQSEWSCAESFYGESFVAAVEKENVFATQFHPEKSGEVGLRVLRNFLEA